MTAAATSSLSLLPTTSSSASGTRPSLTVAASLPTSRFLGSPLRRLCFTGAAHPAPKLRCLRSSGKSSKGVFAMAKKCVGDLSEADLKGKKVLLRADLDVPLDDDFKIIDDARIRAAVRTVKYLIENGARVIICSSLARHRPIMKILGEKPSKGDSPILSLAHLVPRLSELLGIQVVMAEKCIGPDVEKLVASLPEGGVLLLENLKFSKEEEKNEPEFAKKLASLADLYVNDAFRLAFTAHASTEGVTKFLKPSVAGLLFQKELKYLVGEVSNPKRPFAVILGGRTVSSTFKTIETCLENCDFLLLGGAMIFTFYRACGYSVGKSPVEDDIDLAVSILEKAKDKKVSLVLPTDVGIIDRLAGDARFEIVRSNAIPRDWFGVDIGSDSVSTFFKTLDLAKTILWCGALEAVCVRSYSPRTVSVARKLAHLSGKGVTTILAGAYSVGVAESALVTDAMTHATTGARASLELLEGKELPGVLALDEVTPVPTSFV